MKVKKLELQNFKRFDKLTIDFCNNLYKLIVLVGPNGCGKSSVFDAFEQVGGRAKINCNSDDSYLRRKQGIDWHPEIYTDRGTFTKHNTPPPKKFCYLRSAYRVDADFAIQNIQQKEEILNDSIRSKRMIDVTQETAIYGKLKSDIGIK